MASDAADRGWIDNALYQRITAVMPICCVDIVATAPDGEILLVKRRRAPAEGRWWFPGGRVLLQERRLDAARRKLAEECGLNASTIAELGTFDMIWPAELHHGITTVFAAQIPSPHTLVLDEQSDAAEWRSANAWRAEDLHPFVQDVLRLFINA